MSLTLRDILEISVGPTEAMYGLRLGTGMGYTDTILVRSGPVVFVTEWIHSTDTRNGMVL